jgi:hypothetical protein
MGPLTPLDVCPIGKRASPTDNTCMNFPTTKRPADLLPTEQVAAHWHFPINDHAWLTHADVIAAGASTDPTYLERLALECETVGANRVARNLRDRKPTA